MVGCVHVSSRYTHGRMSLPYGVYKKALEANTLTHTLAQEHAMTLSSNSDLTYSVRKIERNSEGDREKFIII